MSNPKSPTAPFPTEPPELAAERDRLLPELERQAKSATGTAQAVLRKLHELMVHTKPGTPFDFQIYMDVKGAFERFVKDPVLPPPSIIMGCVEYMQKRLVALGFTGKMEMPPGAPPLPPALAQNLAHSPSLPQQPAPAPAAAAPSARSSGPKDGFEGAAKSQKTMTLNPENAPPPPATEAKSEQQQLESFKTWMKNPHVGKVKG